MSALCNMYGLYPMGTGPQLPNVSHDLLLPPIYDIKSTNDSNAIPNGLYPIPIHFLVDDTILKPYSSVNYFS